MNPRTILGRISGLALSIVLANIVLANIAVAGTSTAGATSWNTNEEGLVLNGYDVVAYFNEDRAVKGRSDLNAQHDGVRFHFSNRENQAAFQADPGKYTPKFGGFCAFGVAANKALVPTNPTTFKIYNGELLLFFNDVYQGKKVNTKVLWNLNERALYEKAAETWPTLK